MGLTREQKRAGHEARFAEHNKLTTVQKIAKVIRRNGEIGGASERELTRLNKLALKEQEAAIMPAPAVERRKK